jgi:hypothetical protein
LIIATRHTIVILSLLLAAAGWASEGGLPVSPAPEDAKLYFIAPQDGDEVDATFTVVFGLKGMGVAPAGVEQKHTGHHHLLIDVGVDDVDRRMPLPMTEQIRHFGGGQTEAEITLEPGEHTLQLVLGDHLHIPHDPPVVSEIITITVRAAE